MKYMGSKSRIAKHILPIILKDRQLGQWYVEPFCGGCNSLDKVENPRIGGDSNRYLIALVRDAQDVYPYLTKDQYLDIRKNPSRYPDWLVGFAGIIASYCGKWFGGYAGRVVAKQGVRDYLLEGTKNLVLQLKNLDGVVFSDSPYNALLMPDSSIVYCDPPYKGTTGYSGRFDHDAFYGWCREQSKKGHSVFVSEYDMPEDFTCVWEMPVKSSLSANGSSGSSKYSVEKLFRI